MAVYTQIDALSIKRHLIGLEPWLNKAATSPFQYDDNYIENTLVPAAIRNFEREAQFRINQYNVSSNYDNSNPFPPGTGPNGSGGADIFEPPYHYYGEDMVEFGRLTLKERPVQQVVRVRLSWDQTTNIFVVPPSWLHWDEQAGQFYMIPWSQYELIYAGAFQLAALYITFGGKGYVPSLIGVDYIVGLPANWRSDPNWADLNRIIEQYCALMLLNDISYAYDAGVMGKSVNVSGFGQHLNYDRFQNKKQELMTEIGHFMDTIRVQRSPWSLTSI